MVTITELVQYRPACIGSNGVLPEELTHRYFCFAGRKTPRDDVLTPFEKGKEWAFEFLSEHQPRTAEVIASGTQFYLAANSTETGEFGPVDLVIEVNGQVVCVQRQFENANPDDPGYRTRIDKINATLSERDGEAVEIEERHLSLPEPIRLAYYHRLDGMRIPERPSFGVEGRILPCASSHQWDSIDGYLGSLRLKKRLLPIVEEMIPGIKPKDKDNAYTNFMMFLSSWGSFEGKTRRDGDHLFVKNHIQDGVVYYIRDADVENMSIIADPAEAIDRYCEHVLLRREERFDFRPWAVPLEGP